MYYRSYKRLKFPDFGRPLLLTRSSVWRVMVQRQDGQLVRALICILRLGSMINYDRIAIVAIEIRCQPRKRPLPPPVRGPAPPRGRGVGVSASRAKLRRRDPALATTGYLRPPRPLATTSSSNLLPSRGQNVLCVPGGEKTRWESCRDSEENSKRESFKIEFPSKFV